MKFIQDTGFAAYSIHSYEPGEVKLASPGSMDLLSLKAPFVIAGERLLREWLTGGFENLSETDLAPLLEDEPEMVILGSGEEHRFPSPTLLAPLYQAGVGVEVMNSSAACRTYNVLIAEGRRVAAGIVL